MMPVKDSINQLSISLADVAAARERVRGSIYYSPCPHSQMLSALTGREIYLKLENLQMTGSFKERGALNRIATLTPEQAARGVIAASAGNHAQAAAPRNCGAEVIPHGANYDEPYPGPRRICDAEAMTFIHPFDDALVMA